MSIYIFIPAVIVLVSLSGFFSASEIAFAEASRIRIKNQADCGSPRAKTALFIVDSFTEALSSILVGNNLVNIAASSITAAFAIERWGEASQTLAALGITVVILIFGEIIPKILSAEYADGAVLIFARPLRLAMKIFSPVASVVTRLVDALSPLWTPEDTEPTASPEELVELVDTIEDEGVFTEQESELIRSAIEFTDETAHEIMTPRVDVAAFDIDDGLDKLLADEDLMSYSRIPVFRDTIDNIIGVLPVKTLVKALAAGREIDLEAMLLPPVYVHMTRMISSVLHELRRSETQLAVVADEFGGMMGIVTMEDILEEIVGEIYDETDEIEVDVTKVAEDSFEVDGGLNIDDMFDEIDYRPKDFESEYTTVGGWTTEMLDRFPQAGDSFTFEKLTVEVVKAQSMRVELVRVTVDRSDDENDDEE